MLSVSLKDGFGYKISDKGISFVDDLESSYAIEYSETVINAFKKFGNTDESELFKIIQSKSDIPTIRRID